MFTAQGSFQTFLRPGEFQLRGGRFWTALFSGRTRVAERIGDVQAIGQSILGMGVVGHG
jgi:hypothetical protein